MALSFQGNRHLLSRRNVSVHRCWPLASFPSLHLGLEGGVRVAMSRVVGEGLRTLLAWIVVKELDDEGLLGEVLGVPRFG